MKLISPAGRILNTSRLNRCWFSGLNSFTASCIHDDLIDTDGGMILVGDEGRGQNQQPDHQITGPDRPETGEILADQRPAEFTGQVL